MMLVPRKNFDIFDNFFDDQFFDSNKLMRTDIKEHDDKYELFIDLPGFEKEDINMSIEDGYLIINAKTSKDTDEKNEKGRFIRKERYYGECSRKFYIGDNVTEEDVKASFKNGTLNIEVPKKEENTLPEKKYIEIQ